jgi:flavin-dependent dehydrogenase
LADETFDALVLGGGPAGLACALTLRRRGGRSVAVIERTDYDAPRVGETLAPGVRGLLEYLGVWDHFVEDAHLRSFGTSAAWGSAEVATRDFIMTPFGAGWHLDRRRFDATLADEAERAGVMLLRRAKAEVQHRDGGGWRLSIARDGQTQRLEAPILVDATGKAALVARHAGARRHVLDRMIALVATVAFPAAIQADTLTLIESFPSGWWYSARLPEPRMIVALMTDTDLAKRFGWHQPAQWWELLREQPHSWSRLAEARLVQPPRLYPAFSACVSPAAGGDWIAVGDAACSQDPLSASGIARALDSGIRAAGAIDACLRGGDGEPLMAYARWIAAGFAAYWTTRLGYYDMEHRWPEAPFWQRRRPQVTLDPRRRIVLAPGGTPEPDGTDRGLVDHALLARLCATPGAAHEVIARYQAHVAVPVPDIEVILALQRLLQQHVVIGEGAEAGQA